MVFTWEESTLLTYRMSMKNSPPVIQRIGEVSHFLTVVDLWTMILLPVLCETNTCHRSTGVCENFSEEHRLLWKTRQRLPYWQPHRCKLWPKMAQELNPHGGRKEWSRHKNTQKKNLMEHFWSSFNTRLIVFSWTHCCQDVNCFGIFFFLFKT